MHAVVLPGPNGSNDGGLCTAYSNGQNGHDENGQPGPSAALEEAGRAYADQDGVDNDRDGQVDEEGENELLTAAENIFDVCDDDGPGAGDSDPSCTDDRLPGVARRADPASATRSRAALRGRPRRA